MWLVQFWTDTLPINKTRDRQVWGQSISQRSTSAQNIYTTSDKDRGQIGGVIKDDENDLGQSSEQTAFTNDPDSIHTCIDDIRSDGRKGKEAKGQSSNDKLHTPSSVGGYGATGQRGGTYESKAGDSEVILKTLKLAWVQSRSDICSNGRPISPFVANSEYGVYSEIITKGKFSQSRLQTRRINMSKYTHTFKLQKVWFFQTTPSG